MSRKVLMLLVGLAVVAIAVLVWFFVLDPLRDDIAVVNANIEEQRTRLAEAQVKLAQAESTREEGKRNQARLLELAKMMPTSEEVPSLLLQIQALADQSGIQFIAITPGDAEDSEGGGYRTLPLELEFSGTFFDVSDFIYRVEQMVAGPGRLLAIKALDLQLDQGQADLSGGVSPELSVAITMYAFIAGEQTSTTVAPAPATGTSSGGSTTSTSETTATTKQ